MPEDNTMKEFRRLRRRWIFNTIIEFTSTIGLMITFWVHGETNTMIFCAVLFFWAKADADDAYRKMERLAND